MCFLHGDVSPFVCASVWISADMTILCFCVYLFQDFISQWSLGQEVGSDDPSGSQLGLAWLIPLWVDRDPEVTHTHTHTQ